MDGNWNFYFCRVDGAVASIYLNLDFGSLAPLADKPTMAYVRVYLNNPRQDGLSSDADFDELSSLEDSLVSVLSERLDATFVGRNTSGGCRDFFFYTKSEDGWSEAVDSVSNIKRFEIETGTRSDAEWSTYFNFLYPSARDRQRMQNRDTCDVFESNGDELNSEREIDHWIYFSSAEARDRFIEEAEKRSFLIRGKGGPDENQSSYWTQIFRIDVLSRDNIDNVCLELFDLAQSVGGDYDGWEAPVHSA